MWGDTNLAVFKELEGSSDSGLELMYMFDLEGMRKVGKRVANEIINVYEEGLDEEQSEVAFLHKVCHMQLPPRRATLAEEKEAEKIVREYLQDKAGNVVFNDVAKLQIHLGILRRIKVPNLLEVIDTEVHVIRLGSIAIASSPFELFLNFGNQIKARSLVKHGQNGLTSGANNA